MQEFTVNNKDRHIKVKTEEKDYKVRIPRVCERAEFKKQYDDLKTDEHGQFDLLLNYLETLGLPKSVAEMMYMEDLIGLTEAIGSVKKK